jgi:hypothetical protein
MILPAEAANWIGLFVVTDHSVTDDRGRRSPANSGGRVTRVDETYLYFRPFGLSPFLRPGEVGTRLSLERREEKIALRDIDTIYAAPLGGIRVDEL